MFLLSLTYCSLIWLFSTIQFHSHFLQTMGSRELCAEEVVWQVGRSVGFGDQSLWAQIPALYLLLWAIVFSSLEMELKHQPCQVVRAKCNNEKSGVLMPPCGPTLALSWLPSFFFCSLLKGSQERHSAGEKVGPYMGFTWCELLKGFSMLHERYPFVFQQVLRRALVNLGCQRSPISPLRNIHSSQG